MALPVQTDALNQAVDALKAHGVVPAIAAPLKKEAKAVTRDLLEQVIRDVDSFSNSANPEILPELEQGSLCSRRRGSESAER